MKVSFDDHGIGGRLIRKLNLRGPAERISRRIVTRAKANAPEKTGATKKGIRGVVRNEGRQIEFDSSAPHWVYPEYGTGRMKARGFLRKAIEAERAHVLPEYERAYRDHIEGK